MLNTALIVAVAGGVTAQTYPDELDILRGADTTPQIELVLDSSGSMGWAPATTACRYMYENVLGYWSPLNIYALNRLEMVQAVLTGCQSANDGILDQWAGQVMFAVREFEGNSTALLANFNPALNNGPSLEAAVLSLSPGGGTPLARAYGLAAQHISNYFNNGNSATCRQNFVLVMSDGEGNGSTSITLNFAAGNAPVTIWDTGTNAAGPHADDGALYMSRTDANPGLYVDSLPGVTGVQPIRTYAIGFQAPTAARNLMTNMAASGDGQYYDANSYQQLNDAFTQIILSVVARSNVTFNPGTIQNNGLFSGNYIYVTSFRPYDVGNWHGTTKKYCVIPTSAADDTCLFTDDGSGNLSTNAQPLDMWTSTRNIEATVGGTGAMIWSNLFGVSADTDPVPAAPLTHRTIYTWRPGQNGYVRVDGSGTFSESDSWSANRCDHYSLMNKLHGYTSQVADCQANNFAPVALERWPVGDTIHGDTVLLKYSANCEAGSDQCYVATVANDGMLHLYNAVNGIETAAIIPGHLWDPRSPVTVHKLRDIMDQPNLTQARRYYFDGGVKLFHLDDDNNGYINGSERAYLIAGMGRGGYSYVLWNVNRLVNGVPTNATNPPQELMVDQDSPLRNLRETWAAPWLGRYRHSDNSIYNVAVFPSGHDRATDQPLQQFARLTPGLAPPLPDTRSSPQNQGCAAFGLPTELCNPPLPATNCTPCNNADPFACPLGLAGVVGPLLYCYDWPGWTTFAPIPFNQSGGPGVGHDLLLGPFSWSNAQYEAVAYRVVFDRFDLQAGDYIAVLDSNQQEVGRITGSVGTPVSMPWVNDTEFSLRFVTDGLDTGSSGGFRVQRVQFIRRRRAPTAGATTTWRPSMFVMDLDRWNGPNGANARNFSSQPGTGDTRQATGLLARITSDCEGIQGGDEVCVDFAGSDGQPPQPDLQYMVCPISAEPSVLSEGGLFEAVYFGDECGQIWRAGRDPTGTWNVRRLLRTNNQGPGGFTIPNRASYNYRKIFTQVELVLSTCNGSRAVGVYFATGNVQRPALFDNLNDPLVTRFPGSLTTFESNVMGVVWDHSSLPSNAGLENLENISTNLQVTDPRSGNARNGWIVEINSPGKFIRDPLVFDGVAYFTAYVPTVAATECISAEGIQVNYAVNNCTGRPAYDGNSNGAVADSIADRVIGSSPADIGTEIAVITPRTGEPIVVPPTPPGTPVNTIRSASRRTLQYFMWRTTVDPLF